MRAIAARDRDAGVGGLSLTVAGLRTSPSDSGAGGSSRSPGTRTLPEAPAAFAPGRRPRGKTIIQVTEG